MLFTLLINQNNISLSKSINYTNVLTSEEVEISEEQYNQITDFPIILTLDNKKVINWEKVEPSVIDAPVVQITIEERLAMAEDTINFLLGL